MRNQVRKIFTDNPLKRAAEDIRPFRHERPGIYLWDLIAAEDTKLMKVRRHPLYGKHRRKPCNMEKRIFTDYLLITMLSLLTCVLMVHEGMPKGHDLVYEFVRLSEYVTSLKDGGFPVRWSANLEGGYGEPIFNFFPPLFLFVSAVQVFLGVSIATAAKGAIFIFTLAGGIGMYLFAGEFYERRGALLSACVYVLAPYHLCDIYIRNAYSEYTACSLAPFVFWGIALVCREKNFNSRPVFLLAASGTLFALSHNLSLIMYTPLFTVFFLLNMTLNRNWESLVSILVAGILVFCLSAFYILPVLIEKEFVQTWQLIVGKFNIFKNFTTIGSLFGMSNCYSMTPLSLIVLLLVVLAMISRKKEIDNALYANLCLFSGILLMLLFLTTSSSRIIWETFSFMQLFQFPWRLLSPVTFVLCFLAGSITFLRKSWLKLFPREKRGSDSMLVLPVLVGILFTIGAICVFFLAEKSSGYVIMSDTDFTPENIRKKNLRATVLFEYRPVWVKGKPELPLEKGLICSEPDAKIKEVEIRTGIQEYSVSLSQESVMTLNLHYFPGWRIYDNGNPIPFKITIQGLMAFILPAGNHHLKIIFENTPVRTAGNFLSILGLLGFGVLLFPVFRPPPKAN